MTPTLDALADQPDLARGVPRETPVRVLIACGLALIGAPTPAVAIDQAFSDTLTTEEAARLLGIAPRTLSHRARHQPYGQFLLRTGTRRLAFSRRRIEQWQQEQAGSPPTTPAGPSEERKRGEPRGPVSYSWLRAGRQGRPSS